ncbi:MAG: septum formation initiator family protein [Clostridia bacterium]|nr:septum formation initiator family protein [Clostridia bacterium]
MKKRKKIFKIVFLLLVIIYVGYILISQQKILNEYKADTEKYALQIKDAQENKKELESFKENVGSVEYIEGIAREKLGMYLPNERVYIDVSK